jgi:O-antigen ligase
MAAHLPLIYAAVPAGHALQRTGVIVVALLGAVAVLAGHPRARVRAWAMLGALALTPVLLLSDIWDSPQILPLRNHPARGAAAVLAILIALGVVVAIMRRRPTAVALLSVAALPFRIPISSGGTTSNLLVPLYLVVAAGVIVYAAEVLRGHRHRLAGESGLATADAEPPVGRLERLLVGLVLLYAVQAIYSSDFSKALEQVVFFYVPFTLLFVLLRRVPWTPRLLMQCLGVVVALALVFVAIGYVEYSRRQLLLNPKVIASNQVDSYFRVNSLFFDPNIYGRFLALVMLAITAVVLWSRRTRPVLLSAAILAFLWGGLVLSFSQSSIGGLLLGLAVLSAVRFSLRDTFVVSLAAALLGGALLLAAPNALHVHLNSSQGANNSTSGRYTLIKGGLDLFAQRPLQGFGPASFAKEYRSREKGSTEGAVSASHTIPITVAAEQGVLGLVVYLALLIAAFARLMGGIRGSPARAAIAAAFAALVLHTMLYAAFLEDPLTWTLLALGTSLAWAQRQEAENPLPPSAEPAI